MLTVTQDAPSTQYPATLTVVTDEQAITLRPGLQVTVEATGPAVEGYVATGRIIGLTATADGFAIRLLGDVDRLERQIPLPAHVLIHA